MSARVELAAAVEAAWAALDLPVPPTTGVCRACCMDPAIEADFLTRPARELPLAHVRDWYFAACAPDLGYPQMGWILPRALALLAAGEAPDPNGIETVLRRLPGTGFPEHWPAPAVAAVRRFAHAWLAVIAEEARPGLDESLCMIALSGLAIEPFLARLEALPDADLAACLHADWVVHWRGSIRMSSAWTDAGGRSRVWAWYTGDALADRMTRAGLAGDERAAAVSDVIASSLRG